MNEARRGKKWPKNGNETRFFPKEQFVFPLYLIYAISDQIFHCCRVVMKNFYGEIILLSIKNLTKKWRAHQKKFIKFHEMSSHFEKKFVNFRDISKYFLDIFH